MATTRGSTRTGAGIGAVLLACGLALPGQAAAASADARRSGEATREVADGLAPLIQTIRERFAIPAVSVALVRGDAAAWSQGFGLADVAAGRPASAHTVYRAGSLAKPLTAVAVMHLAERGALDLDRPLAAYLPAFSIRSRFDTAAAPITVRSVLTHHAGLPTDLNKGMWTDQPFTAVAESLGEEYACFPPNTVFAYSNVGYSLLGHLVERISGIPYGEYMQRRVLGLLGMGDSALLPGGSPGGDIAKGYRNGREMALPPIRDLPAAGLSTSAADLGRFMQAALSGWKSDEAPLLRQATWREAMRPQNREVALDLDLRVGLGWFLERDGIPGGGLTVRHGGTTLGFSAEMILLPERGLGVAVLANGDGSRGATALLAERILALALAFDRAPRVAASIAGQPASRQDGHPLADHAGSYATDLGLLSLRPQKGELCALTLGETVDLAPHADGGLAVTGGDGLPPSLRALADVRLQARRIDDRDVLVAIKDGRERLLGEKVGATPVPEAWRRRLGSYQLLNPDPAFPLTEPRLLLRDGQLCMSYRLPLLSPSTIEVPLRPVSDTEAIILGLGRMRGETLRAVVVDGEERLRYSGFEGRRIGGPDSEG